MAIVIYDFDIVKNKSMLFKNGIPKAADNILNPPFLTVIGIMLLDMNAYRATRCSDVRLFAVANLKAIDNTWICTIVRSR